MGLLGNYITTVQEARSHVFSIARVTLDHLVVGLEAGHGDFLHAVGFVLRLAGGGDGRVGHEWEVDAGVGDQVGLEFVEIDVKGAVKAEGGGNR